jgi:hypothetical protein
VPSSLARGADHSFTVLIDVGIRGLSELPLYPAPSLSTPSTVGEDGGDLCPNLALEIGFSGIRD